MEVGNGGQEDSISNAKFVLRLTSFGALPNCFMKNAARMLGNVNITESLQRRYHRESRMVNLF